MTTTNTIKITGHEAIAYAEHTGCQLHKHTDGGVIGVAAGEHRGEGLRHPTVGTLRLYEEVLGRPFPVRARGLGYLGGAVEVHGTATVTAEEYARLRAGFGGRQ